MFLEWKLIGLTPVPGQLLNMERQFASTESGSVKGVFIELFYQLWLAQRGKKSQPGFHCAVLHLIP